MTIFFSSASGSNEKARGLGCCSSSRIGFVKENEESGERD
jgi:hypothetical protein